MKGTDKLAVICRLHNSQQELGKSLKAGQTITVAGPFSYLDGANVRVVMSYPIGK